WPGNRRAELIIAIEQLAQQVAASLAGFARLLVPSAGVGGRIALCRLERAGGQRPRRADDPGGPPDEGLPPGDTVVPRLRGGTLDVYPGEVVAVMGPPAPARSTFMNVTGCLDRPTSGTYLLDGIDLAPLDGDALAAVRNRNVGFVFQGINLPARMSAL